MLSNDLAQLDVSATFENAAPLDATTP